MFVNQKFERGQITIALAAVAGLLTLIALTYFMQASRFAQRAIQKKEERVLAEISASELLEFFRSMSEADMVSFLGERKSSAAPFGYVLCSKVNILDRFTGITLNLDPAAELDPSHNLSFGSSKFKANRFYQVQVVNQYDLTVKQDLCDYVVNPAANWPETYIPTPGDGLIFLVSVGVSWTPVRDKASLEKSMLSSKSYTKPLGGETVGNWDANGLSVDRIVLTTTLEDK